MITVDSYYLSIPRGHPHSFLIPRGNLMMYVPEYLPVSVVMCALVYFRLSSWNMYFVLIQHQPMYLEIWSLVVSLPCGICWPQANSETLIWASSSVTWSIGLNGLTEPSSSKILGIVPFSWEAENLWRIFL